jgi:hypothetical protein
MDRRPIKTQEQDVDMLFVEELVSSKEFGKWLLNKLDISGSGEFKSAWRSVNTSSGETDIAALFRVDDRDLLILIENKIYAPEQQNQSERYHERGDNLVEREDWNDYLTCILAPEKYLDSYQDQSYDKSLTYEDVLEWFEEREQTSRMKFKQEVLEEGIERARTGYQKETNERTEEFYSHYQELARNNYPLLEYRKPDQVGGGNTWMRFNPDELPSNVTIIHKVTRGVVDLQIPFEDNASAFREEYGESLGDKTVHNTGKSVSIRSAVPKLPPPNEIDPQEDNEEEIIASLEKAENLRRYHKNVIRG